MASFWQSIVSLFSPATPDVPPAAPKVVRRRLSGPPAKRAKVDNATFDPPSHGGGPRPLNTAELQAVLSGTGTTDLFMSGGGASSASYEGSDGISTWKMTGLYPNPGYAESMSLRSPVIASGLWRKRAYAMSKDVRVGEVKDATAEDEEWAQFTRDTLAVWFPHFWGRCFYSRDKFGFALFEKVWDVVGLRWRLEDMVWIHPSTIYGWVIDPATGFYVGILQISEKGGQGGGFLGSPNNLKFIGREKLAYFGGRGFMGRNYSAPGALRPLYYLDELSRELWTNYAASAKIIGEGWVEIHTDNERGSTEWNNLETLVTNWSPAENRGVVLDTETTLEPRHGGGVLPDLESPMRVINTQIAGGLDGELHNQGNAAFGNRALGETQLKSTNITQLGECSEVLLDCTQQIVRDIYWRNGWDVSRLPPLTIPGMIDPDRISRAQLIHEISRDNKQLSPARISALHDALFDALGVDVPDDDGFAPPPVVEPLPEPPADIEPQDEE